MMELSLWTLVRVREVGTEADQKTPFESLTKRAFAPANFPRRKVRQFCPSVVGITFIGKELG